LWSTWRRVPDHDTQSADHGRGRAHFHNFNVAFRDDPASEVVAFTAAQIPGISDRRYPTALAGKRYADGIPIL
jgi:predicted GTPase